MRDARGQALIELALCTPVVVLLAMGTVASVQVASARSGLDAATQGAAEVAARAPSAEAAIQAANARFRAIVAEYPMESATLVLSVGAFDRSGSITASSAASIDIGWAAFLLLPSHVVLHSQVRLPLESWRSRT